MTCALQATISRSKLKLDVANMILRRGFWEDQFKDLSKLVGRTEDQAGEAIAAQEAQERFNKITCAGELPFVQLGYDASPVKKELFLVQETSLQSLGGVFSACLGLPGAWGMRPWDWPYRY